MDLDKKILRLLEQDAHLSSQTIATMLDTEESKVQQEIKRMEDER